MPEPPPSLWRMWVGALLVGAFIGAFTVVSIATNAGGIGCN